MLCFMPVDPRMPGPVAELAVRPDQSGYIESVPECLAEAAQDDRWRPLALMDGGQPVGFAMAGYFAGEGEGRMWLDRLLIDARYQGRGYGKAALRGLIRQFFAEGHGAVYLSLYADNAAALKLYQAHGFVFTGELDTKGERIMRLTRDRASWLGEDA